MPTDESYIRDAIDLARAAVDNGNTPFGSLLVVDGDVVKRAENSTRTDDDIAAHPEFTLARWAARELTPEERGAGTMYTSTEPCPMCASAIHYARLGRVVYSVSGRSLIDLRNGGPIDIPCAEVIDRGGGSTKVDGPILEDEGLEVHREFY